MIDVVKVRFERDEETGELVKVRIVEQISQAVALRRRYGLPDDAPDSEVTAVETAAQAVWLEKRQRERKREQGAARIKQFDIVALEAEVNALPIAVRSPVKKMFQLVRLLIQERELNDADTPPDS